MIDVPKETKDLMSRYLLGTATSVEQQALEDRYAADPEVFEQLVAVENELADRYARRELSAAEQAAFEQHVLAHPRRRARVEFAEALRQAVSETAAAPAALTVRERLAQWWQSVSSSQGMALGWAAAALLLTLAGWGVSRWLRPTINTDVAQHNGTAVTPRPLSSPMVTPTLTSKPPAKPNATPGVSAPAVPAFVTFTLQSGLVRGNEADTPTLTIPAGTDEVRLRLKSDASGYARYRLTLQQADGRILRNINRAPQANTFTFNLPARLLTEGEYTVALFGLNPDGEADALSKTTFRVQRRGASKS
jgi:hypothetical protein